MTNSATGRAYLAYAPDDIEPLLAARPLRPLASGGTYTRAELTELLAGVRSRGHATAESETSAGMNGLSAPLFRPDSARPVAVISVSGPDSRWDADAMREFAPTLLTGIAGAGFGPATPAATGQESA